MFPSLDVRTTPSAQGQSASLNGVALEAKVAMFLKGYGYSQLKARPSFHSAPYFIPQLREPGNFLSIYGNEMKVDFFIWHPSKYQKGMLMECKYQETPGSVDMKLPYTVMSLKASGLPCMLLLEGQGPTAYAIDWCKNQQDEQFMFMHGYREFQALAQRGLF